MNLERIVAWYQKIISKYDKHKWEQCVEQRLSKEINNINLKTKTSKAELIDVDLVRGSSFPKAKPKQTLLTVLRLAVLRILFLPFYKAWWVEHTSQNIFKLLIGLYMLQLFNCSTYTYNIIYNDETEHIVSLRDIIFPNLMSLVLSIIHSQIVATSCTSIKRKVFLHARKKEHRRVKRSRKFKSFSNNYKNNQIVSELEKTSNIVSDVDRSQDTISIDGTNYVQWNKSSKCPNGLRKRNMNFNHIFSPYWLQKSENDSGNLQPQETGNCDEPTIVDDGFESFNGKNSSGDDIATQTTPLTTFVMDTACPNIQMPQRYSNHNDDSTDTDQDERSRSLSPVYQRQNNVITSPWRGATSNSECSYSSECNESESKSENDKAFRYPPSYILNPGSNTGGKITCTIWQGMNIKKAEMSVLDISSVITNKVQIMPDSCEYVYIGIMFSVILAFVPAFCRLCEAAFHSTSSTEFNILELPMALLELSSFTIIKFAFGSQIWEVLVLTIGLILRFCLIFMFFLMLAVAERTFKERLLYAKLFSHLTSSRRARKSEVPHFRLSKLRNIKVWLSVRSYLKKRGPQRSVDVIVSAALILNLVLISFLCAESINDSVQQHWQYDLEVFTWSCTLGCFMLRFMTLGTAINAKYRSVSILITEQINLYLKMEQNPEKKQALTLSSNVLKLAADLLKELESPFKISGFNVNPYLGGITRVVIVSALSGVCSEVLGFKLKLFKLKEK